jgi:hypothetical protein
MLAHSHNPVEPTAEQGRTVLLAHDGDPATLHHVLVANLAADGRVAILARRTDTIDALKGHATCDFPGGCKLAEQLSIAASNLRTSASKAGQLTSAALAKVLLDDYFPTKITLERHKTTPRQWRQAVWHLLTTAATTAEGETWYDWVLRLRPSLTTAAIMAGIALEQQKITAVLRATNAMRTPRQPAVARAPTHWPEETVFSTVHGVKGDEFEIVTLYYPKPKTHGTLQCITKQWWNNQDTEERRVAFVATTRAMRVFILCVHKDTYNALQTEQPAFFACFNEHVLATTPTQRTPPAKKRLAQQTILIP